MSPSRYLLILLTLFAVLGFLYSAVTPIYEAPDEVWHDAYVRWVARGNGLPPLDTDASDAYQEAAQPPLYYLCAAAARRLLPDDDLPARMWHNPYFGYQAGGTVNDNKNMLIHTNREQFPWTGAARAIHLTRLISIFFGLVTVAATWALTREALLPNSSGLLPLWAAGLVAMTPQFLFISGIVSNDSAAAALSTLSLWAIARVLRRGVTVRRALVLGLLVGLAALTKTSALLLTPLALAAILLGRGTARQKGGAVPALGVAALAVGGWWYARNALLYGDPLGISRHVNTPWGRQVPASLATLIGEIPRLYRSFWGAFGWGHVEYPTWMYLTLGGIIVLGLVGWGRALARRSLPAHGGVLLLAAAWYSLVFLALLQWMRRVEAPHGRLLFPAISAWGLLIAAGWDALGSARPVRRLLAAILGGLLLLNLLTPFRVIRPAFAPPRLMAPEAAGRTVKGWPLVYGGKIRLLGATPKQPSVAPGETLTVRACWEALTPMEKDYTVFIQLVGRGETRVGERHTYPGLGRFPTSLWPVGRAFCDEYRLRVEPWVPVPELYDGLIGLYDGDPAAGLSVVGGDSRPLEVPIAFQVRVAPERPLAVTPTHPLDYRLGEAIHLGGYDFAGEAVAGGTITVTLYWRADGAPSGDYRVFVHLLDGKGEIVAQHDGPPRWGRYPTTAWQKGDAVPDEHALTIPAAAEGPFSLAVGMYRADTMERLPVAGPAGTLPDGRILLEVGP